MKPVSPVFRGVDEVIYAKDQPQYNPLPAIKEIDGNVITRWKCSWRERLTILFKGDVYLQLLTFNRPLQPVQLSVEPPVLKKVITDVEPIFHCEVFGVPGQKLTADQV